jgi:Fe-S-cluster containining protein
LKPTPGVLWPIITNGTNWLQKNIQRRSLFRVNVMKLTLPILADRKEDLPLRSLGLIKTRSAARSSVTVSKGIHRGKNMINKNEPKGKQGLLVLKPEDAFKFNCNEKMDCFTRCCRDITIFLTPYDVLRMKNALHMSSADFLDRYTATLIGDTGLPVVVLKMLDDDEKRCPFVTSSGCLIYADRPWACRIYPLQPESTPLTEKAGKTYYSVMNVPFCLGLEASRTLSLAEYIQEQGIPVYMEMEALFKKITTNERLIKEKITNKQIQEMYFMACYDLDRFHRFVFESTFLDRFDIEPQRIEAIKSDDAALYRFAMQWLEYGLLAQHVMKVKPKAMAAKKAELGIE